MNLGNAPEEEQIAWTRAVATVSDPSSAEVDWLDAAREAWEVCREQEWPVEMFQGMLPAAS
ncbi:hypothetical protein BST28_17560 [Mycolicibacter kumamotonensis]|uniref:Uncharacterized protein n=1 Tax=Mycolicibacter kumamotonensis TaxID=354243 RepID=A0A1X0E0P7_9MYCO|nr:hypothetical protein [Mycolicibacter kumamotonensis]ORA77610.1 hypothetical protein BST28_17560 [Mycolicibacter kumamotonensis]